MQAPVKRKPVKIAYIGGGSLNWAITLMADLALTPVTDRMRHRDHRRNMAAALADESITSLPKRSNEALVDQIAALTSGNPIITNVNPPNMGQMQDLPRGTIVDTNAVFSGLGVVPVQAGRLPETAQIVEANYASDRMRC